MHFSDKLRSQSTGPATMRTFADGLAQRPEIFNVTPAQVAETTRLVEEFTRLHARASDRATRTSLDIAARNEAHVAAREHILRLAKFIQANPNVSDGDRALLGLDPPTIERRRVPAPETRPILVLTGVVPGGHEIDVYDAANPHERKRSRDVAGLELFVAFTPVGARPITDAAELLRQAQWLMNLTRSRGRTTLPNDQVNTVANYIGRWMSRRREPGPWSEPVRMTHALPQETPAVRKVA